MVSIRQPVRGRRWSKGVESVIKDMSMPFTRLRRSVFGLFASGSRVPGQPDDWFRNADESGEMMKKESGNFDYVFI